MRIELSVFFEQRYINQIDVQCYRFMQTVQTQIRHSACLQDVLLKLQFCLFVFVALRPKSTAMVIAGRSVHLTTLFPGQACTSG